MEVFVLSLASFAKSTRVIGVRVLRKAMPRNSQFVDQLVWRLKALGAPKESQDQLYGFVLQDAANINL